MTQHMWRGCCDFAQHDEGEVHNSGIRKIIGGKSRVDFCIAELCTSITVRHPVRSAIPTSSCVERPFSVILRGASSPRHPARQHLTPSSCAERSGVAGSESMTQHMWRGCCDYAQHDEVSGRLTKGLERRITRVRYTTRGY